jgi:hypothetical protein
VPDTFAVPQTSSHTLSEPAGEVLQVWTNSLRPGNVEVHLQLANRTSSPPLFRSISVDAISDKGGHASAALYTAGKGHEIADVHLDVGIWKLRISGVDSGGHSLSGSIELPIN